MEKKYAGVQVGTLRSIINNIKDSLTTHKRGLKAVKDFMDDNTSWKCTAKNTLIGKLEEFPVNNHDTLEEDYQRAETIFGLVEQVQKLYKEYDDIDTELTSKREELKSIVVPGYDGGPGFDLVSEADRLSVEMGNLTMKLIKIEKDAKKLEEQIENA